MADRRTAKDIILEAASDIFRRYGFRRSSMDDIARAAHMSRQNLYFHYSTKEALFEATVEHGINVRCENFEFQLINSNKPPDIRLLDAFQAAIGDPSDYELFEELLDDLKSYSGEVKMGKKITDNVVLFLEQSRIAERWTIMGFSAQKLAEMLLDVSRGIEKPISSATYREKMRPMIEIICYAYPPQFFIGRQVVTMQ